MMPRRAFALGSALACLFLIDAGLMRLGWLRGLDQALLGWDRVVGADRHFSGSPALLASLIAVTELGGALVRAPLTIIAVLWLALLRSGRYALTLGLAVATGALALPVLKLCFGRARPDQIWWLVVERHQSFPSGHAMGSMILYPLLGWIVGRMFGRENAWVCLGIAVAIAVGCTRFLLGVHWSSDVLAGWLIGGAWAFAAIGIAGSIRAGEPPAR